MKKWYNYLWGAGELNLKKLLAIIPMLAVLGGFLLNSSNMPSEQVKQTVAEAKQPIVLYSEDPGGW